MDFLLLLPQGVRVVIEVDGKHHYADRAGGADVQRYAQMVRGDCELKLAGYEVFRFGAAELQVPTAKEDVKAFFEALFKRSNELITQSRANTGNSLESTVQKSLKSCCLFGMIEAD
ncbi:MAG: hypothetical protein AAGC76_04440 [Luteibacter sp.]|uniref:hypothetical protein n=1 Tax=Luteibacter sp. TaxID=1886636 RepID=UPI00280958A8|nr:hypothetical protein [Luteibacter sp.]MDQ7995086.1 hypothetical protein [Luteibacter sp.]MDQ8047399.1 hypothetical protein [Luteibacter sp.]